VKSPAATVVEPMLVAVAAAADASAVVAVLVVAVAVAVTFVVIMPLQLPALLIRAVLCLCCSFMCLEQALCDAVRTCAASVAPDVAVAVAVQRSRCFHCRQWHQHQRWQNSA